MYLGTYIPTMNRTEYINQLSKNFICIIINYIIMLIIIKSLNWTSQVPKCKRNNTGKNKQNYPLNLYLPNNNIGQHSAILMQ